MATNYKNIVITPNIGSSTDDPKIQFSGGNTSVNTDITLKVYPASNGTLSFEGSAGQLFSITNDLTGSIFSVNDVSGIPSIDVYADGTVELAPFGGNVGIGTTTPLAKLDVVGTGRFTSSLTVNGNIECNTGDIFISRVSTAYGYVVRPNVAGYKKLQFAVSGGSALEDLYVNSTNTQIQGSLGIGTAASGTSGEIRATNNITAYYSDKRLKSNVQIIDNALNKVNQISGVTFQSNEEAAKYGYTDQKMQVGVLAQEIEAVLPEIVVPAPFDIGKNADGTEYSLSGQNYKTVHYDKLVPLLIEAIKELSSKVQTLEDQIGELQNK